MTSSYAVQGFQLCQSGKPQDGVAMFEQGLRANPKDADCLLGLARVRVLEGNPTAAKPLLQRLLAVNPAHTEAQSHLALIQYDEGEKGALALLEAAAAAPGAGLFELLNLARVLNVKGEAGRVEATYRRAIALEPRNAFVRSEAGEAALRRHDAATAVEHFEAAAKLAPGEYVVRVMLMKALRAKGDTARANSVLREALALAPDKPAIREELFQALFEGGAWQEALNIATQLKKSDPTRAQYDYFLGISHLKLSQWAQAQSALQAAVAAAPQSVAARHALAQVHMGLEQTEEAKKELEEVLKLAPDFVAAVNDLAVLYFNENPPAMRKAEKILRQAIERAPDDAATLINLATALADKEPKLALAYAKKAKLTAGPALQDAADRMVKALSAGRV